MNRKILAALLLAVLAGSVSAQTKEKPKEKKESITIRKKSDDKEKLTIVIDGDNITVNGKPVEDLKDEDIEVIRNKAINIGPRLKGRIAPGVRMQRFSDDFGANAKPRPLLGVISEKNEKGAKIVEVNKESAAEKAGLQKDDIITRIDDNTIESSEDLYKTIGQYKPADKVSVTYLRNGKQATTTATLGKGSSPEIRSFNYNGDSFNRDFNFDMPQLRGLDNFNFDMNMARRPKLGVGIQDLETGKGVKVIEVENESAAAKAGLQTDDIVTELDGKAINSVDELRAKLREIKEGDTLKLTYLRGGQARTADIKFPRKLKTADL